MTHTKFQYCVFIYKDGSTSYFAGSYQHRRIIERNTEILGVFICETEAEALKFYKSFTRIYHKGGENK